jgi:peptide chain release factor subunit 1
MISLIIPPRDQIPRIARMLADEYGTASNIKSRVNRLSVLSAITSVQARLRLYNKGIMKINKISLIHVILF